MAQSGERRVASSWQERAAGPDAHDTRGKTAPQRLRRLDQFLMALEPGLLSPSDSTVIDLGYGRATESWTSVH